MQTYTFMIASLPDHEKVVAEIYCDGQFVAQISQERGVNELDIEFASAAHQPSAVIGRVELVPFLAAVEKARRRLLRGESGSQAAAPRIET